MDTIDRADASLARRDLSLGAWLAVASVVLGMAVVLGAALPRYELTRTDAGTDVVVFDRWTGHFQRVVYSASGEPQASPVVRPF
jgi:hypothetical protein